jgi:hypothetical protein
MKVDAQNYEQMRAWFARLVPETVPADLLTPENDPVGCLDQLAVRSPAKARSGLAMAIGDTIEATEGWPGERVAAVDHLLEREGLPSLTEMRLRFSKVIRRVVGRGSIKNEVEYYAVRNAAELTKNGQEALWKLLATYEGRAAGQ